ASTGAAGAVPDAGRPGASGAGPCWARITVGRAQAIAASRIRLIIDAPPVGPGETVSVLPSWCEGRGADPARLSRQFGCALEHDLVSGVPEASSRLAFRRSPSGLRRLSDLEIPAPGFLS